MIQLASDHGLFYSNLAADPDVAELVEMFVENFPQRIAQLELSLARRDWDELRRTAHQLKGAAGSYGFGQLTPALCELARLAGEASDPDEVATQVAAVRDLSIRLRSGVPSTG